MASISDQIANIRTMQDVINLLMILFTNLNNQNEMYYDMFLNPVPMDIDLERYDENGELVTVTLPNRAKERLTTYSGEGDPNGSVVASQGALYIDTLSYSLYYKGYGSDSNGWILVYSARNLSYLAPDGDGSALTNLNANNISSGRLSVARGGTGTGSITGLIKGNGTSAFTAAIDGVDYLGSNSMTGIICFYPIYDSNLSNYGIPTGWLRCDGYKGYLRTDYPNLFAKLGTKYGSNDNSTFGVPNMTNLYVKGWDGTNVGVTKNGQVGKHLHALSGSTGTEDEHTHTRGNMNITGYVNGAYRGGIGGAFYDNGAQNNGGDDHAAHNFIFDASLSWTGNTSGGSPHSHTLSGNTDYNAISYSDKNEVDHITLVPIIKY